MLILYGGEGLSIWLFFMKVSVTRLYMQKVCPGAFTESISSCSTMQFVACFFVGDDEAEVRPEDLGLP